MVFHAVVLLFSVVIGVPTSSAVDVVFKGDWKTGVGWELVCSWTFPPEDKLQSVHMYRGSAQFKIYRPEMFGSSLSEDFNTTDSLMRLECSAREKRRGTCVLTVQPNTPPASITVYACEVSGERPWFRMKRKEYELEAFVPSTDAQVTATKQLDEESQPGRVVLNCSAAGIPAPALSWTVGHQAVQGDFSGKVWNPSTRLMHSWSTIALTPTDSPLTVLCVPEQRTYRRALALGPPADFLVQALGGDTSLTNGEDNGHKNMGVLLTLGLLILQEILSKLI